MLPFYKLVTENLLSLELWTENKFDDANYICMKLRYCLRSKIEILNKATDLSKNLKYNLISNLIKSDITFSCLYNLAL